MTDKVEVPHVRGFVEVNPELMGREQLLSLVYAMLGMINDSQQAMNKSHDALELAHDQREAVMDTMYALRNELIHWYSGDDTRLTPPAMIDKIRTILIGH